ncbi:MAG: PDZ domain-containing protein [Gammaproteobacteria bacterium PRO9]|nr:PDZ domain-containing protein [Gammaproteobacteria bacterium PRO9]
MLGDHTIKAICFSLAIVGAGLLPAHAAPETSAAIDNLENMPIGDPARRDFQAPLVLDGITDTSSREVIGPAQMARRLDDVGILFIGETHTNQDFHDAQLTTIQALHEAGRDVLIGLEMFPYTQQKVLDAWIGGKYSEQEFPKAAEWYRYWGHNWNYYSKIFRYARDNKLPMYGVNTPQAVVKKVRAEGFDSLNAEERAHFPPVLAPETDDYKRMFRASFSPDDALHMNAAMLDGLYRAQITWDSTMGWNALQALKAYQGKHKGSKPIMVVLIGSGHVIYGMGAERQIDPQYDGKIASLVPVPVINDTGSTVSTVRASYASFIWGLPQQREPDYPVLGVSLMGSFGKQPMQVINVSKDSVAERAGIQVGDVLESIGNTALTDSTTFKRIEGNLRWGDTIDLTLQRKDKPLKLTIPVRRVRPAACSAGSPGATAPG